MSRPRRPRRSRVAVGALVAATLLPVMLAPVASGAPDGLERVAIDHGFAGRATEHPLGDGPLAGYAVRAVRSPFLSTAIAGLTGVAFAVVAAGGAAAVARRAGGPGRPPGPTSPGAAGDGGARPGARRA